MSREAAFLVNNLLFAGLALVVLLGTVFPLLVEALQDQQSRWASRTSKLGAPIGIALLFLMAVAPALPWRAASGEVLRQRLLIPAWVGGSRSSSVLLGARGIADVLAFALGAFAVASIARRSFVGCAPGGARTDEGVRSPPCARCAATRGCTAGSSCTSASS